MHNQRPWAVLTFLCVGQAPSDPSPILSSPSIDICCVCGSWSQAPHPCRGRNQSCSVWCDTNNNNLWPLTLKNEELPVLMCKIDTKYCKVSPQRKGANSRQSAEVVLVLSSVLVHKAALTFPLKFLGSCLSTELCPYAACSPAVTGFTAVHNRGIHQYTLCINQWWQESGGQKKDTIYFFNGKWRHWMHFVPNAEVRQITCHKSRQGSRIPPRFHDVTFNYMQGS